LQRLRIQVMAKHFDDESLVKESNMDQSQDAEYIPQALQLIRSMDAFRIVIKSEQLAMQDMAALRQEKTEFLQGLATFLSMAQPMVEKFPAAAPPLLEMLKWAMTGFKGSSTIEGVLDKAIAQLQQNPPAPAPDPAEAKAKQAQMVQQMKLQGDAQREKIKVQGKQQEIQAQTQSDLAKIQAETQAEVRKQAAQFAFDTKEQQRQAALDSVTGITTLRRPGA